MAISFPPLPPTSVTATLHEWRVACGRIQSESMAHPRWENIHRDPINGFLVWRFTGKAITPETVEALQMMYRLADLREPVSRGDILVLAAGIAPPSWESRIPLPRDFPAIAAYVVMRRGAGYGIDPTSPFLNRIRDRFLAPRSQPIPNPAWRAGGSAPEHINELTWFDSIPRMPDKDRDYLRVVATRTKMTSANTYGVLGFQNASNRIQAIREAVLPEEHDQYNQIAHAAVENRSLFIPRIWEVE